MADSDIVPFGVAIAGDVLSAFCLPGGNTLSFVASGYVARKRKQAAETLIREISSGRHGPVNFEEHDLEPFIEMTVRFAKAVSDGAARENLIFLAQVIAGLKKNRAFDPDRFRRWCKVLEALTRDELIAVGLACQTAAKADWKREDDFNTAIRASLGQAGYSEGEAEALLTSVGATGLLSSASAWGGLAYVPTPWLKELADLVDVESMAAKKI